ncbi:MAG TPA: hypothetical protein VM183_18895 [Burkholderiales bacterium]|nr:hypothetical protein [Burkholderiales bacterium]
MSRWLRSSALAVIVLAAATAYAADDAIVITAVRDPVDKSYRRMVKGMDLFEEMHALAPKASLRYKLYPRKHGTDMSGLLLHVIGERIDVPVVVAPDNTFTLVRDAKALKEDARVRSERRAESMTWRADIRTPGLAPDTRRLGDLRLECHVGVQAGLISQYPGLMGQFLKLLQSPRDFCNRSSVPYLFFAERPLFSVTLRSGERSQALSVGQMYAGIAHGRTPEKERRYCDCEALLDRAYILPLGDASWPDDTLVELRYMDSAAPPADDPYAAFVGSTKAEVRAAFGDSQALRFDSGFEVWAYDFGPPQSALVARTELVFLFDRSGVVANTRLRP